MADRKIFSEAEVAAVVAMNTKRRHVRARRNFSPEDSVNAAVIVAALAVMSAKRAVEKLNVEKWACSV